MAVNLKELSNMLGLSQTTVSRAINGYPEVAEETRARVMEAARATGYRASQAARHLARGAPRLLGAVLPNGEADYQVFATLLPILVERAVRLGFRIVLLPPVREDDGQNVLHRMLDFDIEGLIWVRPNQKTQKILRQQHPQIPTVFLDLEGAGDINSTWVTIDHAAGVRSAATLLYQLGHRELHLILDGSAADRSEQLIVGARLAAETFFAHGKEEVSFSLMPRAQACGQLLRQFNANGWPSAIIASDMTMFRLLSEAALENGLVVGRDVSIVGQDVAAAAHRRSDPAPATLLRLGKEQIAAAVVETIAARIREPGAALLQVRMKPDLVLGWSTGSALLQA